LVSQATQALLSKNLPETHWEQVLVSLQTWQSVRQVVHAFVATLKKLEA
jgi:hypothetical protein